METNVAPLGNQAIVPFKKESSQTNEVAVVTNVIENKDIGVSSNITINKNDKYNNSLTGESPLSKKWTVLMYLNGNNNTQAQALSTVRLSEFVGSSKDVNILAQVSRNKKWYDLISRDWSGARRYYITKNPVEPGIIFSLLELLHMFVPPYTSGITSKLLKDLGKVDMGSPETLKKAIMETMKEYPSQHYMVWMKMPSQGTAGFSHDTASGNKIRPDDLKKVLNDITNETGHKIEIVTLEGSTTSSLEMAHELKDGALFLGGTQEVISGNGFAAPAMLNEIVRLNDDPDNSKAAAPRIIAQLMGLIGTTAASMNPMYAQGISFIDLSKIEGVSKAVNNLSIALQEAKISEEHLANILKNTQGFGSNGEYKIHRAYRDLYHFAELLSKAPEIQNDKVKTQAKEVMEQTKDAVVSDGQIPFESPFSNPLPIPIPQPTPQDKPDYSNVNGLSINLDPNHGYAAPETLSDFSTQFDNTRGYKDLSFTKDTEWEKFLTSISKEPLGQNILRHIVTRIGADFLQALSGSAKGPIKFLENRAENVGSLEAFWGWKEGKATDIHLAPAALANWLGLSVIGIPAGIATKTGIAGGAITMTKGISDVVKGLVKGKKEVAEETASPLIEPKYVIDKTKIQNGLFNMANGASIAGINAILAFGESMWLLNPLGYAVFGIPIAQTLLGLYKQWQSAQNSQNAGSKIVDPLMTRSNFVNAVEQYIGKNKTWD